MEHLFDIESMKRKVEEKEKNDDLVVGISTAFPKHPPPPGIAYSKNYARFLKQGQFAIQIKE